METNRQKKRAGVFQKDLVDVLQKAAQEGISGVKISVTKVNVTSDLSVAKVYLSIFPQKHRDQIMKGVTHNNKTIRYEMAQRTKHQLRRMPSLEFFSDDSLDYIEDLEDALKGKKDNPIKNPTILSHKKKS